MVELKQAMGSWAAAKPVLWRAGIMLSAAAACLVCAQLLVLLSKIHPLDMATYKMRGSIRRNVHTGCCGIERKWQQLEVAKRHMPKDSAYSNITAVQLRQQLPIRVLSLARAHERRNTVTKVLHAAGLQFKLVDAVDADNASIPLQHVTKYVRGVRLRFWQQGYSFQRKKVAVDLSHYQNLERILTENRPAVLLEDDVGIAAAGDDKDAWYKRLLSTMQGLPQDWDVLYLNICYLQGGRDIGAHLKVVRHGVCTLGYVATPRFARKVLAQVGTANLHFSAPVVDLLYSDLIQHMEVAAYIASPPLANFTSVPSTMNYEDIRTNLTMWDMWWMGRRRLQGSYHQPLE